MKVYDFELIEHNMATNPVAKITEDDSSFKKPAYKVQILVCLTIIFAWWKKEKKQFSENAKELLWSDSTNSNRESYVPYKHSN